MMDNPVRTPIRPHRPIACQADLRSYLAPCTCDHTEGSVHFLELEMKKLESACDMDVEVRLVTYVVAAARPRSY